MDFDAGVGIAIAGFPLAMGGHGFLFNGLNV
jgi:hypothetical protein